jgi:hypothetical protein
MKTQNFSSFCLGFLFLEVHFLFGFIAKTLFMYKTFLEWLL